MLIIKPIGLTDEFVVGCKKRQEPSMLLTEAGRAWGNLKSSVRDLVHLRSSFVSKRRCSVGSSLESI